MAGRLGRYPAQRHSPGLPLAVTQVEMEYLRVKVLAGRHCADGHDEPSEAGTIGMRWVEEGVPPILHQFVHRLLL
jgi:hypothetical protein